MRYFSELPYNMSPIEAANPNPSSDSNNVLLKGSACHPLCVHNEVHLSA